MASLASGDLRGILVYNAKIRDGRWWVMGDELSENTVGKDCTEIYQKTREVLQHFKEKKGPTCNTTKEEWEAIKTLREDPSHVVLTVDKGVALVVMDKSQYIDKCMALLNDTKVYKPCKDARGWDWYTHWVSA